MKTRLPVSGSRAYRPKNLAFMKQAPFWIYQVPSIVQSIAAYLPQLWISSFAAAMGFPSLAVSLINLSASCGYLVQGRLVDRFHATIAILISTVGAMVADPIFWGFATNQAMLYVFSILWGMTGAGFPGSWTVCVNDMRRSSGNIDTGLVLSLMCAGKGIGSVVGGPLSEQLLRVTPWSGAGFAYGSQYGAIIILTGVGVTIGGTSCVVRLLKLL